MCETLPLNVLLFCFILKEQKNKKNKKNIENGELFKGQKGRFTECALTVDPHAHTNLKQQKK